MLCNTCTMMRSINLTEDQIQTIGEHNPSQHEEIFFFVYPKSGLFKLLT